MTTPSPLCRGVFTGIALVFYKIYWSRKVFDYTVYSTFSSLILRTNKESISPKITREVFMKLDFIADVHYSCLFGYNHNTCYVMKQEKLSS